MLHHIKGKLVELNPTQVVLECGGLGYLIHISLQSYTALSGQSEAMLFLHPLYKEDSQSLYGFSERQERELFVRLLSVSGVGGNTARTILSSLSTSELIEAIGGGQAALLQSVKGIGAKTAQRIILDLKDKMGALAAASGVDPIARGPVLEEASAALEVLGYSPKQSERILVKLYKQEPGISVEQLIKAALKSL